MAKTALFVATACLGLAAATTAQAEVPAFTAECPTGITVTQDLAGIFRVNGVQADVRMYNANYFEASAGGITFPISTEADGSGLVVGFNPPGSAGGYCTVVSVGSPSAPSAGADGPDHFEVRVNGRLNLRAGTSTSSNVVGYLPNGTVVENLGCLSAEGRTWCRVTNGRVSGWAASEFLVEAGGPVRSPRATTRPAGDSASAFTTERVSFPRGSSGTEFTDSLDPGVSHRYLLNARNGQFFYFRLAANGPRMTYTIYNPDGSVLLDQMSADREYRGQLWQSGDHIVEVSNTANGRQSFNVIFGID